MRRLSILAAAVAACLLFTACPNKPTDEPVVIPDGIYRETAENIYSFGIFDNGDTIIYNDAYGSMYDTVVVSNGQFLYDPCADTINYAGLHTTTTGYSSIYDAVYYCLTGRVPVYVSPDGYVHFDSVSIYGVPFDFCYTSPVHSFAKGYRFDNTIHYVFHYSDATVTDGTIMRYHKFVHTLTPLSE